MVLVTIVNKNIYDLTPIVFEFKEQVKTHIIVYDKEKIEKKVAKALKINIDLLNKKYNCSSKIHLKAIDEDKKEDMISIQKYLTKYNDKLYLNATHSDMSLIVILSGYILNNDGLVISYDKYENSYNLIHRDCFLNHQIKNSMKIEDFLLMSSFYLTKEENKEDVIDKKENLFFLFQNFGDMFLMRGQSRTEIKQKYPSFLKHLKALEVFSKEKSYFGILFEKFIYLQLLQFDFDDIKLGAVIDFGNGYSNEFDILAIKENHIYTIECKIGGNYNIKPNDVIYKCDSLLDYFGDDSKSIIVNIQNERDYLNFKENNILRARENNIAIYNNYSFKKKDFAALVSTHFTIAKRVFLLGGYDLEMIEIRKILQKYRQIIKDKKLSWGAKLSAYKDKNSSFSTTLQYYGIELEEDIKPPERYTRIDHHNHLQDRASSLEQVAEIFGEKLSRWQQLVAKNDSGYIKAMLAFGATQEEIKTIRSLDRKAQGVTQEDEQMALSALKKKEIVGDIVVVQTSLTKFSPIADRLFDKNVLIYNNNKLVYYGKGIEKLVEKYSEMITQKKLYYGGGYGFFGLVEGGLKNEKKVINFKDEILENLLLWNDSQ